MGLRRARRCCGPTHRDPQAVPDGPAAPVEWSTRCAWPRVEGQEWRLVHVVAAVRLRGDRLPWRRPLERSALASPFLRAAPRAYARTPPGPRTGRRERAPSCFRVRSPAPQTVPGDRTQTLRPGVRTAQSSRPRRGRAPTPRAGARPSEALSSASRGHEDCARDRLRCPGGRSRRVSVRRAAREGAFRGAQGAPPRAREKRRKGGAGIVPQARESRPLPLDRWDSGRGLRTEAACQRRQLALPSSPGHP
jgi:hypothetical protein